MYLWIGLVFSVILYGFVENFMHIKYLKYITILVFLSATIFHGFRYMLGNDYESYVVFFNIVNEESIYPEYSFRILVGLLKDTGFSYQMMFLIYSIFTSLFVWKGITYYIKDYHIKTISILFYLLLNPLFWESMSMVRQSLAIAMFLYASRYILERKIFQYMLWVLIITMIHTSGIILVPIYWLVRYKTTNKKLVCIVILGILLSNMNILSTIIMQIIGANDDFVRMESYSDSVGNKLGLGNIFQVLVYIYITIKIKIDSKEKLLLINMYALSLTIYWLFYFLPALARLAYYFWIFQIIIIPIFFHEKFTFFRRVVCQTILIICYGIILLHNISATNGIFPDNPMRSVGNIEYKANFELRK